MFSYRIIIILFSCLFAESILPTQYSIGPNQIRYAEHGWPSKKYIDLRYGPDGSFFAGTNSGLGKIDPFPFSGLTESTIEQNLYKITDLSLPEGGNPAVKTYPLDNGEILVIVSGVIGVDDPDEFCVEGSCQVGTGVSWSMDSGETWQYMEQPLVSSNDEYSCDFDVSLTCYNAQWGDDSYAHGVYRGLYGEERALNVSFEVAADTNYEYIYAASWYGLLRRFKYTDENPTWESVPLPKNSDDTFYCDDFPPENYYYGSIDDNHRPFSVEISDGYIWVGSSGVNKGEIVSEYCINWTHYTRNNTYADYENYNYMLPSDWVTGIYLQKLDSGTRVWTINWSDPPNAHHLAYTDNYGETWIREPYFSLEGSVQAIVYNLYSIDSDLTDDIDSEDDLYASTSKGLFKFEGLDNWVKEQIADEQIFDEMGILNENNSNFEVQTAIIDGNDNLLVGTTFGLLVRDADKFYYPSYVDDYLEGFCIYDCLGICDGDAVEDCAGVCNGNTVEDCAGECDGFAIFDCAGECNGSALYDCEGMCGGEAECNDNCISGIYDCLGVCDGSAVLDCLGVCDGSVILDCTGECGGSVVEDCAGECGGSTIYDCEGVCGGSANCNDTSANRVYPNPYLLGSHTKATFLIESNNNGKLEVYDFSMSKVFEGDCTLQNQGLSCDWDGSRNNDQKVTNGVYFLKVISGGKIHWTKLGVINK